MERPAGVPPEAEWSEKDTEWIAGPRDGAGRFHGLVRYWRPDGSLCCECPHVNGEPHGISHRFHESGEPSQTATYDHGVLHGPRIWYATDEETTEKMHGPHMSQLVRRAEIDYDRGVAKRFRYYAADGQPVDSDGSPCRARPAGVHEDALYHPAGGYWALGTVTDDDQQIGPLVRWTADGTLECEEQWREGRRHGANTYHRDGRKRAVIHYDSGRLDGTAELYRPDGSLLRRASFRAGEYHGSLEDFDERGAKIRERRFEHGHPEGAGPASPPKEAAPGIWELAIARGWGGDDERDAPAARAHRRRVLAEAPASVRARLVELGLDRAPRVLTAARLEVVVRSLGDDPSIDREALADAFGAAGGPAEALLLRAEGARARAALRARLATARHGFKLDLSRRSLERAPADVGTIASIVELDLSHNRLRDLPPEVGDVFLLQRLDLGDNTIEELPDALARLGELRVLHLPDNGLRRVPPVVFRLPALDTLNLADNQLESLPDEIGDLTELDTMWLSDNPLRDLPRSMRRLKQLTFLHLGHHLWKTPPACIFEIESLKELWLASPHLEHLPPEVAALPHLERLHIWYSALRELPEELFSLRRLRELRVRNNPLPPETLDRLRRELPDTTIY